MTDITGGTETFGLGGGQALSQGMERYFKLLRQQAELSRQLAVGWAGAMQTMSGVLMTQTTTMRQLAAVQTAAIADQSSATVTAQQDHRRPVLGLIHGSAPEAAATEPETSPTDWAVEQENLRYNVFDEVFARLLEDDIEEAVV
jgi:hypothetical protein